MNKKQLVYKRIRELANENDCDNSFLANFDACYSFMYEVISDLSVDKQILITVKTMSISAKSAKLELRKTMSFLYPKN